MNWRAIFAIVGKDLRVIGRSRAVLLPLLIVPFLFTVLLPIFFAAAPQVVQPTALLDSNNELSGWLDTFPPNFRASLAQYTDAQLGVILMGVYFFAPMYLILPLMVASVVAADSLAGERERRTLEALLYTPTTDRELLTAKLLSAWLPAVGVAWLGFILYSINLNAVAWPLFGYVFFPVPMWWILALWVAPAMAGLGLGITVLVSARVNTFQEAYQIGGLVVLPVIGLMISQSAGALYFGPRVVFFLGLGAWSLNALLYWLGVRLLRRARLLPRQ